MGFSQSVQYSVEVPNQAEPKGCTRVRRNPDFVNGLWEAPQPQLKTMKDIVLYMFTHYTNNKYLGKIIVEKIPPKAPEKTEKPETLPEKPVAEKSTSASKDSSPAAASAPLHRAPKEDYIPKSVEYLTYGQVREKVDSIGAAINDLNLAPEIEEVPGLKLRFLAMFSKNRMEWTMVDLASILYGYVIIPIYDTLGPENIPYVFNQTQVETCFCSKQSAEIMLRTKNLHNVKNVVCFDHIPEEMVEEFKKKGVKVYFLDELIQKGDHSAHRQKYVDPKPDDVLTFCYTSGTTGPPKGAMLSHKNISSFCAVLKTNRDCDFQPNDSYLSYLPLAHVLERLALFAVSCFGCSIAYYSGDVQKINLDLAVVKPTFFVSVPRLFNRIHEAVESKFSKVTGWKKTLLEKGLSTKIANLEKSGTVTHPVFDRLIFKNTKEAFGGNVRLMISGSAPLLPHVENFIKVISSSILLEGYGQTESTGASFVTNSNDPTCGHVGGPTANIEFKLEDVPELGYRSTDLNDKGEPCPRGEVCMRGPGVFLGYYKEDQKTKETIDKDGWLHTGDIGMILPSNGALKLIDRKKNIFKLQQGEYVAAEKVEAVYLECNQIEEIFLHGESTQNYCVAIVVPTKHFLHDLVGKQGNLEEKVNTKQIREKVLGMLNAHAKKKGLMGFEQAKNIFITVETFQEKAVVSTSLKLQRHEAKKVFADQINAMYQEGMLGGRPE